MVALDEEVVPLVQPFEKANFRELRELAIFSPVASLARKDQIPDSVNTIAQSVQLQYMGKEVIDICKIGRFGGHRYVGKAVKTFPLLVSVQGMPAAGNCPSLKRPIVHDEALIISVVCNSQHATWQIELPSCLNEPPASFYFGRKVLTLICFGEAEQVFGEPDSLLFPLSFIRKKTLFNLLLNFSISINPL